MNRISRYVYNAALLRVCLAAGLALALTPLRPAEAAGSGTWSTTGSMSVGHWLHTATRLPNGQVLVAGGFDFTTGTTTVAELYDPATGTWSATGSMNEARWGQRAVLLHNGKVLVAGSPYSTSAELYDPASGTWSYTGSMNEQHGDGTLTLLPDGRALMAGGSTFDGQAELYDPTSGTWSYTSSPGAPLQDESATLLPNGKVLVAGGYTYTTAALATAELYDPGSDTWTPTGNMITPREGQTATLLSNGKVLVAGGRGIDSGILSSAELYDPASGTWSDAGNMTTPRAGHTATLLPDGTVLVAGGDGAGTAELYDPSSNTWTAVASMSTARYIPTATLLPNGTVLVAGGLDNASVALASAEIYAPGTQQRQFTLDELGLPSTVAHDATFDGQTVALPFSTTVDDGSRHSYSFPSPVSDPTSSGTRYVTTDQGATVTVTGNFSDTAAYSTQYYLTVQASPAAAATGNATLTPSSWEAANSTVPLAADALVPAGTGNRYRFTGWSGAASGTSTSASVVMSGPEMATAGYTLQHQLSVTQSGLPAGLAWHVTVNGISSAGPVNLWLDDGTSLSMSADALLSSNGIQYFFQGFSASAPATLTAPFSTAAVYLTMTQILSSMNLSSSYSGQWTTIQSDIATGQYATALGDIKGFVGHVTSGSQVSSAQQKTLVLDAMMVYYNQICPALAAGQIGKTTASNDYTYYKTTVTSLGGTPLAQAC